MAGERLNSLVPFESVKLAASLVLLSPFVPLLFMGDEYGETAPFQYFVSHTNLDLIRSVRDGRKKEFSHFNWLGEPPDPQSEDTFSRSKLNHQLKNEPQHRVILEFHRELIRVRTSTPALALLSKEHMDVVSNHDNRVLTVRRWNHSSEVITIFNFNDRPVEIDDFPFGRWHKRLDSADVRWHGPGSSVPPLIDSSACGPIGLHSKVALVFEREIEE
jgi:maltooligosyltrehalose trehalohydrolase